MYKRNNIVIGLIFVLLGFFFLLKTFDVINFNLTDIGVKFWPAIFLILPGLAFHSIYFSGKNKDAGILVPGGILLVVGITCQISTLFDVWDISWPGFIFAVAVGLFELYLFGGREKGLLIPVGILGILSLIFFDSFTFKWLFDLHLRELVVPVALILLGIMVIFRNIIHKGDSK